MGRRGKYHLMDFKNMHILQNVVCSLDREKMTPRPGKISGGSHELPQKIRKVGATAQGCEVSQPNVFSDDRVHL